MDVRPAPDPALNAHTRPPSICPAPHPLVSSPRTFIPPAPLPSSRLTGTAAAPSAAAAFHTPAPQASGLEGVTLREGPLGEASASRPIGMVKPGGRSKMGKGGKGKGFGAGGAGGSGSAPPSPTRRLKKGGKRGRRLCHMDGCTLCPSFGFEGEVAVSCSHHKEPGMRNLTARRCQHEGCFTVANFGMPGDKPGFCAAHSTKGMVNRNKPRGAEGVLAGVPIARSSRRAAKANTAIHSSSSSEAARSRAPVSEAATRSSYRSTYSTASSGTESCSGQTSLADGDDGDEDLARKFLVGRSASGERLSSLTGDSDEDLVGELEEVGQMMGAKGAKLKLRGGEHVASCGSGTSSPAGITAFVARVADPPEVPDVTHAQYSHKRAEVMKASNGGSRVRARGSTAVAVTAGMQLLQRPVAAAQEAFLAARNGMKTAQRTHPEGLLLGGGAHRVSPAGLEAGFPGDARNGGLADGPKDIMGGFLLESNGLDAGLDCNLNMDLTSGLDELLRTEDSLEVKGKAEDPVAQISRGMVSSVMRASAALRPASCVTLASSSGGSMTTGHAAPAAAMECEGDVFVGDGAEDFGLVSLPGLNGMDLAGLNSVGEAGCMGESARQGPPPHPPPTSHGTSISLGLNLGAMSVNGGAPPTSSPRIGPNDIPSTDAPSLASEVANAGVATPSAAVLSNEDAWWDVLEGEEYVAMPEPIWGVGLGGQGLEEELRTHEDPRSWRGSTAQSRGTANMGCAGPLEGTTTHPAAGREALPGQGMGLASKSPALMSSLGLCGGGIGMSDESFIEDKARVDRGCSSPVFPFMSCRPPGDRDDLLDAGPTRVSPKKRPRLPSAGEMAVAWLSHDSRMTVAWVSLRDCRGLRPGILLKAFGWTVP